MIAGSNGAGKTTSAMGLLPSILQCEEYVNADLVAAGLAPFNPDKMALAAGRLMLERLQKLAKRKCDFAFETTGATRSFAPFLSTCQQQGYTINLIYLQLEIVELTIARVAFRVANGGHNIPEDVIKRRYHKSKLNLTELYQPIANNWVIYDNSAELPQQIAQDCDNELCKKIDLGVHRGVAKALAQHGKLAKKIVVFVDGKLQNISAKQFMLT